jgi:RHH-type transcriptional regulator, rel operon repressor / antitoxin RelB
MPTDRKTLNLRLPTSIHAGLLKLAGATGRSKNFLAVEALDAYIEQQSWQIAEIKSGIIEADKGEFATDEEVNAFFKRYAA